MDSALQTLYSDIPTEEKESTLWSMTSPPGKWFRDETFFLEACRKNDPVVMKFFHNPSYQTIQEILTEDYEWGIAWLLKRMGIETLWKLANHQYQRVRLEFYHNHLDLYC